MSALVRLYPRAWRERYETEFLSILTDRPPRLGERLDILLAAVDAHLDPQVSDHPSDNVPDAARGRRSSGAAALAIGGGALWLATAAALLIGPLDAYGHHESDVALALVFAANVSLGAAAIAIGARLPSHGRAAGVAGALSLVGAGLMLLSWPWLPVGIYLGFAASFVVGAILVDAGAPRVGAALAITSLIAFGVNTAGWLALFVVPLSLVWMLVGARLLAGPIPARSPAPGRRGG